MPLSARAEFLKTKIAVLDFQLQGQGHETADMGKIVAEWLITALVKEGRFEVVERRLLRKILEEQKLVMAGVVDENSATQLGKLLGVKVIISGSVIKFQNVMEVNARIIDVESAAQKSQDKDFQAMMYHKIGKVYDELSANQEKAKEYWQKAVSTAPDSEAAQLAGEKLASVHP